MRLEDVFFYCDKEGTGDFEERYLGGVYRLVFGCGG